MPRPRLRRFVAEVPKATYFKPQGLPLRDLTEVRLSVEGLEAIRLADLEGLTTEAAAVGMGVSRHTFGRILAQARASVARALVNGAALRIEGGDYAVAGEPAAGAETGTRPTSRMIAVPSLGPSRNAPYAPCFGRSAGIMLVDLAAGSARYLPHLRHGGRGRGGAGHLGRALLESGAQVLLSGELPGPLWTGLTRAGIAVVATDAAYEGLSVDEAIRRFTADHPAETEPPRLGEDTVQDPRTSETAGDSTL